jgi:hypothetical protein
MEISYSFHAKKRMKERGIREDEIKEVIEYPEYTIKRGDEIEAYKKIKNKMTKVVYVKEENYIKVITVYKLI